MGNERIRLTEAEREIKRAYIRELDIEISKLGDKRSALKQDLRNDAAEFSPGDIIEWEIGCLPNKKVRRGVVLHVVGPDWRAPDYVVENILASGKRGKQKYVYSWNKPRLCRDTVDARLPKKENLTPA